jgi:hypothetical protein
VGVQGLTLLASRLGLDLLKFDFLDPRLCNKATFCEGQFTLTLRYDKGQFVLLVLPVLEDRQNFWQATRKE